MAARRGKISICSGRQAKFARQLCVGIKSGSCAVCGKTIKDQAVVEKKRAVPRHPGCTLVGAHGVIAENHVGVA